MIYTCLSHEIVADGTTHALLDGLRERYTDPSSAQQAGFHEAFGVVIWDCLAEQMGSELAGVHGHALRRSISLPPNSTWLSGTNTDEAHNCGEVLVAAVLNAFVAVWVSRLEPFAASRSWIAPGRRNKVRSWPTTC